MKWWPAECRFGDMIRVKLGSIYHYGIFVSEDEVIQFGLPPIPENASSPLSMEVCSTDINAFSTGAIIEVARFDIKEKLKKFSAKRIVGSARARVGEGGYDIIHNNCEHFVYECVFGEKKSPQVDEIRKRWNNGQMTV